MAKPKLLTEIATPSENMMANVGAFLDAFTAIAYRETKKEAEFVFAGAGNSSGRRENSRSKNSQSNRRSKFRISRANFQSIAWRRSRFNKERPAAEKRLTLVPPNSNEPT